MLFSIMKIEGENIKFTYLSKAIKKRKISFKEMAQIILEFLI